MANIILSRLTIDNFKGCRHFELAPNRKGCTISGENAAGKTTIFDAYMWLLWGKDSRGRKDFDIKPLLPDGTVADHAAITSVEGEFWADNCPITLKRTYYERWSAKRGRSEATFDGHSSDYYIDEVPTQKNGFDQAVAALVGSEDTFRILTSVTWFPEQMKWQDRRAKLFDLAGIQDDRDIMATDVKFAPLQVAMGGKDLACDVGPLPALAVHVDGQCRVELRDSLAQVVDRYVDEARNRAGCVLCRGADVKQGHRPVPWQSFNVLAEELM